MKTALLCVSIVWIVFLSGMEQAVMPMPLTYPDVITLLKNPDISPRATRILNSSREVQHRLIQHMSTLCVAGLITSEEEGYLGLVIAGNQPYERMRGIVHDVAVYCALLCDHTKLADELFRQDETALTQERVSLFFPRLFCLGMHRGGIALASNVLQVACTYLIKIHQSGGKFYQRRAVRNYFAQLLPVFFLLNDCEGLVRSCTILGAHYLLPEEERLFVAIWKGEPERLNYYEGLSSDAVPFLYAFLLGCSMKYTQGSFECIKMIMKKLRGFGCIPQKKYLGLLKKEAEVAGNSSVIAYLESMGAG